jgi:hypothetical protein
LARKNLKIVHLNVRGITNKIDQIEDFLNSEKPDLFLVNEHGLDHESILALSINNYDTVVAYGRKNKGMGGTAIFKRSRPNCLILENVKPTDIGQKISEETIFECVETNFTVGKSHFTLVSMYRSPYSNNLDEYFRKLYEYLDKLDNKNRHIIIGSDFNIDILKEDYTYHRFKTLMDSFNLRPNIFEPTRITDTTSTCIDNFLTNFEIQSSLVLEPHISDHCAISIEISLDATLTSNKTTRPNCTIEKRIITDGNLHELKFRLQYENWSSVYDANDVNDKYDNFINTLRYYYDISCPYKKIKLRPDRGNKSSWMNDEVIKAKEKMFQQYSAWKLTGSTFDKNKYLEFRKQYRNTMQQSKSKWAHDCISQSKNKSRDSWKVINSIRPKATQSDNEIVLNIGGQKVEDPVEIGEIFNDFFVNVANTINEDNEKQVISGFSRAGQVELKQFHLITPAYLLDIFSRLTPKHSYGIDELSMHVLKYCREEVVHPLAHIINFSLTSGIFPQSCKLAKVKPVFKKLDRADPGCYRPISLLPVVSKLIEKVVSEQLNLFLERNNILCNRQYGFRRNKSTKLALIDFINGSIDAMEAGETVVGCFADLSKAFDCVDPAILLEKLASIGISGLALDWLRSYLTNRFQVTEIQWKNEKILSTPKPISNGVPQGSVLGPLLFLVYINNITDFVPLSNVYLFADDTTLFVKGSDCAALETESNEKIKDLASFFTSNKLKLNSQKTGYMCIQTAQRQNSKNNRTPNLFIGEDQIEKSKTADFLGVRLDDRLGWDDQIKKLEGSLARGLFILRRIRTYGSLPLSKLVYFGLIEQHISYSIILWGSVKSHLARIFTWQKKAVRTILGLSPQTSCKTAFKQLGLLTVPSLFIFESVCYIKTQDIKPTFINHRYNTRKKGIHAIQHRLTTFEHKPNYIGMKLLQALPERLLNIQNLPKFKLELKRYLVESSFYDIDSYLDR